MNSRHVPFRLFVALLTFVIGVMAAAFWIIHRIPAVEYLEDPNCFSPAPYEKTLVRCVPPKSPVAFCDLVNKPDRYDGKIVRVRANIIGYHQQYLYATACNSEDTKTRAFYDSNAIAIELRNAIANLRIPDSERTLMKADVVVIGRFERLTGHPEMQEDWHIGKEDRFQFIIMDVEQVETVASDAR